MADETHDTPPMSDERLAEIRANQIYYHSYMNGPTSGECAEMYGPDVDDLLAEVDRLRAHEVVLQDEVNGLRHGMMLSLEPGLPTLIAANEAAMAIVRAVATKGVTMYDSDGTSEARMTPEIVDAARALLAQE